MMQKATVRVYFGMRAGAHRRRHLQTVQMPTLDGGMRRTSNFL
jgi:hypothetical protein